MTQPSTREQEAAHRLRGNPDYEQIIAFIRRCLDERTTDLVFLKDQFDTARAQGAVSELRSLLEDLAP